MENLKISLLLCGLLLLSLVCPIGHGVTAETGQRAAKKADSPLFIFLPNEPGIPGLFRSDGGNDANNLDIATGKPKADLSYWFLPILRDPTGNPPQYVRAFISDRATGPAGFQSYDLDKVMGEISTAAAYLYQSRLGPAANFRFHYETKLADGTVMRLSPTGEMSGPTIQMLNGINFVGIPRDSRQTMLNAQTAFGTNAAFRYNGTGFEQLTNSTNVVPGEAYLLLRQTATGTLPNLDNLPDVTDTSFVLISTNLPQASTMPQCGHQCRQLHGSDAGAWRPNRIAG